MEFVFETTYDQRAISEMAKALRKTIRKKKNKRTHILGWLVILFAILISIPEKGEQFVVTGSAVLTWIVVFIMILVLLFEDKINGYIAKKRMLKGTESVKVTFKEDGYVSTSPIGKSEWHYKNIQQIAETEEYFIFVFDQSHAQVYNKKGLISGNIDDFRKFIAEKTEKEVQSIK